MDSIFKVEPAPLDRNMYAALQAPTSSTIPRDQYPSPNTGTGANAWSVPGGPTYTDASGSTNVGALLAATANSRIPNSVLLGNTPFPTQVECPNCKMMVTTETTKVAGARAYCMGFMLICWCCLIGLLIAVALWDGFKDVIHSCPNCKQELGRYAPKSGGRRRTQHFATY
ncbi:hypothetical protein BaRGS_00029003 [Batillaria attramentaria]|uniref:LITAF domain-containing protein n=1 Tax=Batillaria attramentaria TaxID=370345 RepID=A0ABD0JXI2_9CAEN